MSLAYKHFINITDDLCNAYSLCFSTFVCQIFLSYTAHVGCCDRCICLDIIVVVNS